MADPLTTAELRETFIIMHTRSHDSYMTGVPLAEVRREYGDIFDAWLAVHDAALRAEWEAEQGEVEWEYGTRYYEPITGGFPVMRDGREFAWDGPKHDVTRVRRTKAIPAGPWVPVEQEGERDD